MSLRRHALLLAATTPLLAATDCAGPPPAADDNRVGSMGGPAAAVAPNQSLPVEVPAPVASAAAQREKSAADYAGQWIGPEGLVLEVRPGAGRAVTIVNQWTLNDRGRFTGEVTARGLTFTRNGETVVARPSDGDATGMKWLAGKRDCLTVIAGSEGYCRR